MALILLYLALVGGRQQMCLGMRLKSWHDCLLNVWVMGSHFGEADSELKYRGYCNNLKKA
jgi:hypothetical protein